MSSSHELYKRIICTLGSLVSVANLKQLSNWGWMSVGIIQANSVNLGQIAIHVPVGSRLAESRVATLRRWLKNPHVEVWSFYRPILEHILAEWRSVEAVVILDGVQVFGDRMQIFRLSLRHGNRAIPLVWTVLPGKGLTQAEKLEAMLARVAAFLDGRVKRIRFLADAGFRDCDWAKLCLKFGWHYNIRIPYSTIVWLENGIRCRIDELGVKPGQRRYFQNVYFTSEAKLFGHLSVTWSPDDDHNAPELVAVMSDQIACRQRLSEYGWRMCIEESFRDDQSSGFDLEHTRLKHPERLERLLLALAIATVWCHELGESVLAEGEMCRREIDPGPQRELSLFQLGLRWLKRCVSIAIQRLSRFRARLSPIRLTPVTKSSNS
ncbi:transposase [Anaerolineae bacterium CFX7]|nr:transposase [Anaerolineae bacterium CFX7]